MKHKTMLAFGLLCVSNVVAAQQSNADYYNEQRNIQQQQWQQEQNRQGYQAAQDAAAAQQIPAPPSRPSGEWIKTWGAIADGTNGEGGISAGQISKESAENEAVKQCIRGGGVGCRPTFSYQNQCVVIASAVNNPITDTIQSAKSIGIAKQMALPKCSSQNNGSACEVVYSACSDPIFRSY